MVDVWCIDVSRPHPAISDACLSIDEVRRGGRFRASADRLRWLASRAALRTILAKASGCSPAALAFECGPYGKPRLMGPLGALPVHFALSRSHDLCLIAVSRRAVVGIDIERVMPVGNLDRIIDQFFRNTDLAGANAGTRSEDDRLRAFFTAWTRIEAYAKATGTGLQASVAELCQALAVDRPNPHPSPFRRGSAVPCVTTLWPSPGYIGALVSEDHTIRYRTCRSNSDLGGHAMCAAGHE